MAKGLNVVRFTRYALALCLLVAGMAAAQTPAVNPKEADYARAQQERQLAQPLNNQPLWSEVRSGVPQVTTVRGRETEILIQPQGQTWRAWRVPAITLGGIIVVMALVGLAAFYLWRGPMKVDEPPEGHLIRRFAPADRWAHWLLAITWVTLAITGLILSLGKTVLLPLIGYNLFSLLAVLSKNVHNFVGPVLIVAIPWLFVRFIRDNGISMEDVRWFLNIKGYFMGHEYPSGKFNAGEKLVFWVVLVLLSTVLVVTGLILVFPNFDQTRQTMQLSNLVHMGAAYVAIGLAFVHIYLGTIGMEGAYRAMRYGYVDTTWAQHHHRRWYEDIVAGRARETIVSPEEAAAAAAVAEQRSLPPRPATAR